MTCSKMYFVVFFFDPDLVSLENLEQLVILYTFSGQSGGGRGRMGLGSGMRRAPTSVVLPWTMDEEGSHRVLGAPRTGIAVELSGGR